MKHYLFAISFFAATTVIAQPKIVTRAIVSTTINVIAPEDEEMQAPGGGGGMNFRNMMDGETKSTTYLKNDMVKTVLKSDIAKATIIRDNAKKMTTTLLEIMGKKQGFYMSDSEQVEMKRVTDSMMRNRRNKDSSAARNSQPIETTSEVVDAGETKKMSGYACKKAYVIMTKLLGLKDTVTIWYTQDIKLQNVSSTGGLSSLAGMANMGSTMGSFDKIDGFVMRYEMSMLGNRRMEVEVTRIDLNKEIEDKEFDIPKDFELKPMKEMRGMFGGPGGIAPRN